MKGAALLLNTGKYVTIACGNGGLMHAKTKVKMSLYLMIYHEGV
jgi:hypothetical protein